MVNIGPGYTITDHNMDVLLTFQIFALGMKTMILYKYEDEVPIHSGIGNNASVY